MNCPHLPDIVGIPLALVVGREIIIADDAPGMLIADLMPFVTTETAKRLAAGLFAERLRNALHEAETHAR